LANHTRDICIILNGIDVFLCRVLWWRAGRSFSLRPSRVWKWTVVENPPCCYDRSYRCSCSTFTCSNSSSWARPVSLWELLLWLFHGLFGSCLTATESVNGHCLNVRRMYIPNENVSFCVPQKTFSAWECKGEFVNSSFNCIFQNILYADCFKKWQKHIIKLLMDTWSNYCGSLFPLWNKTIKDNCDFLSDNSELFFSQLWVFNLAILNLKLTVLTFFSQLPLYKTKIWQKKFRIEYNRIVNYTVHNISVQERSGASIFALRSKSHGPLSEPRVSRRSEKLKISTPYFFSSL